MEFHNKGIVITGAAGVFGRWITERFARDGARLCLSDNRGIALDELATSLGLPLSRTILHATELTDEASILDLADHVQNAWQAPDMGDEERCTQIDGEDAVPIRVRTRACPPWHPRQCGRAGLCSGEHRE
jgi:NAD(P)-dependent dehydrogenase (short-subunit alcohol dehydrogenase family)